jgi:hypothetical protein
MDENPIVVNEELTPPQPSEGEPQVEKKVATPAPGSKTPPELLLKSLHEEKIKREKLEEELRTKEEELNSLKNTNDEVFSDEGKVLERKITSLTDKISQLEEEKSFEKLYTEYPILKEKSEEFKEFRKTEHPNAKLESVAKLYLVDNGFYEPPRKGLEKPTGGSRTPMTSGMTSDEIKTLRETNYKKYSDMLQKGLIKMES